MNQGKKAIMMKTNAVMMMTVMIQMKKVVINIHHRIMMRSKAIILIAENQVLKENIHEKEGVTQKNN